MPTDTCHVCGNKVPATEAMKTGSKPSPPPKPRMEEVRPMIERLVIAYLRSNAGDIVKFVTMALALGVPTKPDKLGKLALVSVEWCVKHGTPTPDIVEAVLRRRKLL